jgi:transcriptional regulator with XRE-family HTH domain
MLNGTPDIIDIRTRRLAAGLSQEKLARAAECALNSVRLFEKGYAPDPSPARDRVIAVLDALAHGTGPATNGASAKLGDGAADHAAELYR